MLAPAATLTTRGFGGYSALPWGEIGCDGLFFSPSLALGIYRILVIIIIMGLISSIFF